jgi:hypothetical protein
VLANELPEGQRADRRRSGRGRHAASTLPGSCVGIRKQSCRRTCAIGDSDLINIRVAHFADFSRTSREVREVPTSEVKSEGSANQLTRP